MDHKTKTVEAAASLLVDATTPADKSAGAVSAAALEWLGDWYDQGEAKAPPEKCEKMFDHLLRSFAAALSFIVAYRGVGSLEPSVETLETVEAIFAAASGPLDPTGLCREA